MMMVRPLNLAHINLILFKSLLAGLLLIAYISISTRSADAYPDDLARAIIAKSSQSQQNIGYEAKRAYQTGRYQLAQTLWQQAYQAAQADNNILLQAQILNYLALTCHKLGNLQLAEQYLAQSQKLLLNTTTKSELSLKAQTLNTQGRLELEMGKAEAALASWQEAQQAYQQVGDNIGVLGVTINQAQAWQSLGLYRRAQKALLEILPRLERQADSSLKIVGLRSLAIALQVTGDLETAQELLQQSLALAQELNLTEEISSTLFSLGNNALASAQPDRAIGYYQQAAATTKQPLLKAEAKLNQLGLLISTQQYSSAQEIVRQIQASLTSLGAMPSRRLVYARVNLAEHLIELINVTDNQEYSATSHNLLNKAIKEATILEDTQAKSYALGMQGHFWSTQGQISLSLKYTEAAVDLAQQIHHSELIYQWQWQLGRLLKTEGNYPGAIASYTEAVNALESLRSDLVVTNVELQFSFRESIEPVYRELVSLLLTPVNQQPVSQDNLLQSRNTIEALQLAELNNFFREACLDATPTNIEQIDPQAAVIYPIILGDRLEVIVSLPDKSFKHYGQSIPQGDLERVIESLRQNLQIRSRRRFYQPAQKLYSWLIRPALKELAQHQIETLVFVPDGSFRNIPLSTLHDGEQYLIEQYNVTLTPGLQLLAPLPLAEVKLKTLGAGITQRRRGFAALKYVNQELNKLQNYTDSVVLRNEQFTQQRFRTHVTTAQYPIVHIATHGQFSSNLEDTFLLAWDGEIDIHQLEQILSQSNLEQRQAIELLILSACETARGDTRAALGLAGMAVRAGARTTLATLWAVSDESTALAMSYFYQSLTQAPDKLHKAQALRQAQLNLINSPYFKHPYYWSPFVMVGNWL